ncbi:MAG: molybdopterin-guanine dinucleotide biosynthesis protein B [Rhodospirillaceae bacterium]|jgi:molybdopterin-guanine dinucleotide biosynthesis adapter protein|nr:molybdopterin-guanine dinucleotide biosynthesis protein B [Rhodospirillaceae bacterium]
MKVFGMAGWSGSGKTTLLTRLLPELIGRGYRVSTIKHTHHNVEVDKPGKDSYAHRKAGATEVMVGSPQRWALMHENLDNPEASLDEMIERMTPVDLLLVEGFKKYPLDKLEIYRRGNDKPLISPDDPRIVAIATDTALPELDVPTFDINDISAIADFILAHCGLKKD